VNRVDGKVALVTGAGAGIGEATAILLAKAGARVVVTDTHLKNGEATAAAIHRDGGDALFLEHDVADETAWQRVIDATLHRWGQLDILVNNAGIAANDDIENLDLDSWRRLMSVDLDGVFLGLKHAIRAMKSTGGSIVNISSVLGIVGEGSQIAYGAAKGGVRSLTKAVALYCADRGYGIRVNSVHPGFVLTQMTLGELRKLDRDRIHEQRRELLSRHPIGRLGEPMDIARAVLFLASEDSSFITGAELVVDGGYTAR
jgi:NAD(P)-dependent dehydrogenase (short-subunit alcohol dehydrogenase family)